MAERPIRNYCIRILKKIGIEVEEYDEIQDKVIMILLDIARNLYLKDIEAGAKSPNKFNKEAVSYLLIFTPLDPEEGDYLAEYEGEEADITMAKCYINEAIKICEKDLERKAENG